MISNIPSASSIGKELGWIFNTALFFRQGSIIDLIKVKSAPWRLSVGIYFVCKALMPSATFLVKRLLKHEIISATILTYVISDFYLEVKSCLQELILV